jgi:hypothetical protein
LLAKAVPVADGAQKNLSRLREAKSVLRNEAERRELIRLKAELDVPREPSVAGIDGSYQVHRLTSVDLSLPLPLLFHWEKPHHRMWAECLEYSKDITNTLRGLMTSMELELASRAPHDLVLLDGSFIILLIYLNQGLTAFDKAPVLLREEFRRRWPRRS